MKVVVYQTGKILMCFLVLLVCIQVNAQHTKVVSSLNNGNLKVGAKEELHFTDSVNVIKGGKVDLASPDGWVYFDNVRPSDVIKNYLKFISVSGKAFRTGSDGNGRIAIYKQGTVVIPQSDQFEPLRTFNSPEWQGDEASYHTESYYTNHADPDFPANMVQPLKQENTIRSFRLKKGYMATFATEADGTGYSRVYIADTGDLNIGILPAILDHRIAYVRVFPWQWPSKKGWCGVRSNEVITSNGQNKQDNEVNLSQSTWFYSWGGTNPVNVDAEFVPMKWGYGGSMKHIDSVNYATHLLGYNEPNRPDQSHMTVDQALSEWPQLMKTGLRLGSPSVSDNGQLDSWLYKFLDECDRRNYRVDYVTVHAYWGAQQMPSPKAWYEKLKEIHLRTHRPIWLTEWNNGANWTKEAWPGDKESQQKKQLNELKQIIQMLDTASFVERYSIYNWVEDKRAIILDSVTYKEKDGKKVVDQFISQSLTPAGWFYRNNHPGEAFNPKDQFVPKFHLNVVPEISSININKSNLLELAWHVSSDKMLEGFSIEQSFDGVNYGVISTMRRVPEWGVTVKVLDTLNNAKIHPDSIAKERRQNKDYGYAFSIDSSIKQAYYRIVAVTSYDSADQPDSSVSNVVGYQFLNNRTTQPQFGVITALNQWQLMFFKNHYSESPSVILGVPTNHNKYPQVAVINDLKPSSFEIKLDTWKYLGETEASDVDSVPYLILPTTGKYDFNGLHAQIGTANQITDNWKTIKFDQPFDKIPVVFVTKTTENVDTASSPRIRNVTKDGFEVELQYEAAIGQHAANEQIQYLAIEQGTGSIGKQKIRVGVAPEKTVGNFFHPGKIDISGFVSPLLFASMQTTEDKATAALRIKDAAGNTIEVFKEQEQSKGAADIQPEQLGWLIIDSGKK